MYGVEGSRVEGWVECESLTGVDTEDFEAEDFLFELKGEIGVSLGVEWVVNKDALRFWS